MHFDIPNDNRTPHATLARCVMASINYNKYLNKSILKRVQKVHLVTYSCSHRTMRIGFRSNGRRHAHAHTWKEFTSECHRNFRFIIIVVMYCAVCLFVCSPRNKWTSEQWILRICGISRCRQRYERMVRTNVFTFSHSDHRRRCYHLIFVFISFVQHVQYRRQLLVRFSLDWLLQYALALVNHCLHYTQKIHLHKTRRHTVQMSNEIHLLHDRWSLDLKGILFNIKTRCRLYLNATY